MELIQVNLKNERIEEKTQLPKIQLNLKWTFTFLFVCLISAGTYFTFSQSSEPIRLAATSPVQTQLMNPIGLHVNLDELDHSFYDLKWVKLDQKMIFFFPDNSYLGGEFELSKKLRKNLDFVIEKLRPLGSRIKVTFVGHADTKPVVYSKTKSLQNNQDLSLVRAQVALYYALTKGFKESSAEAKADVSHSRKTRSLSIIVEQSKN